jgi:hypothetical protein
MTVGADNEPTHAAFVHSIGTSWKIASFQPVEPSIGANVETIADWSAAWTFTDALKSSRPWISHAYNTSTGQSTWEGGGVVHVDSKGWPTQLNQWKNTRRNQMIRQELGALIFRRYRHELSPRAPIVRKWKGTRRGLLRLAARG